MRLATLSILTTCTLAACGGGSAGQPAAAPAPRPVGDPSSVRFAAGQARFRMEVVSNTVQEMMGNTQELNFTQSLLLSTTLAEAAGEVTVALTVDSFTVQGNVPGVDASALAGAQGRTFNARFTPQGRGLGVTTPDSSNPLMLQIGRAFREFLPRLPSAPLVAGYTWTDTVTDTQTLPGGSGQTSTRSVRQSRIVGWEDRGGVRAMHLAVAGTYEITGSGEAQGQPLEITGTGQAAGDRWVSATGQYLGGTSHDSTNMTVNVINVGITVPIRQVQNTTITRLP